MSIKILSLVKLNKKCIDKYLSGSAVKSNNGQFLAIVEQRKSMDDPIWTSKMRTVASRSY